MKNNRKARKRKELDIKYRLRDRIKALTPEVVAHFVSLKMSESGFSVLPGSSLKRTLGGYLLADVTYLTLSPLEIATNRRKIIRWGTSYYEQFIVNMMQRVLDQKAFL